MATRHLLIKFPRFRIAEACPIGSASFADRRWLPTLWHDEIRGVVGQGWRGDAVDLLLHIVGHAAYTWLLECQTLCPYVRPSTVALSLTVVGVHALRAESDEIGRRRRRKSRAPRPESATHDATDGRRGTHAPRNEPTGVRVCCGVRGVEVDLSLAAPSRTSSEGLRSALLCSSPLRGALQPRRDDGHAGNGADAASHPLRARASPREGRRACVRGFVRAVDRSVAPGRRRSVGLAAGCEKARRRCRREGTALLCSALLRDRRPEGRGGLPRD